MNKKAVPSGFRDVTIEQILKENTQDIDKEKAQTTTAQTELAPEREKLKTALADLEALKFSSKSAERAFIAALKEKKLELKDGALTGVDDFIKAQKEADPDAFAPDKAPPRFLTGSGGGGGHGAPGGAQKTTAELLAESIGKANADSGKAANDIISAYTGGKA